MKQNLQTNKYEADIFEYLKNTLLLTLDENKSSHRKQFKRQRNANVVTSNVQLSSERAKLMPMMMLLSLLCLYTVRPNVDRQTGKKLPGGQFKIAPVRQCDQIW